MALSPAELLNGQGVRRISKQLNLNIKITGEVRFTGCVIYKKPDGSLYYIECNQYNQKSQYFGYIPLHKICKQYHNLSYAYIIVIMK